MDVLEISGQFYVVRFEDETRNRFAVLDGPYPERSWAVAMSRLKEIE